MNARSHRAEPSLGPATAGGRRLLQPGRNCWRIEHAKRLAFLVDADPYFRAVRTVAARAEHTLFILGWDIDSRLRLVPEGAHDGLPDALGHFLNAIVAHRPGLRAYVLCWDFAMLYAFEREWLPVIKLDWRTHPRLKFRLDARHPFGASHHQKIVVADDRIAFVGGLDLTRCRWDTSEHRADDPRRRDAQGRVYGPFHDVQMLVEGNVAQALGELARDRWQRATGTRLPAAPCPGGAAPDLWPPAIPPDLTDAPVAIARTEPRHNGRSGIAEIRQLYRDVIHAARRDIFIENQYFTSSAVGDALAARLQEAAGPEIVLISRLRDSGWLEETTMGVLRARLHRRLRDLDQNAHYRAYAPVVPGLTGGVNVHSKVLIADDALLTTGSANLSNRSMGFDTECNLALEAHGDPRIAKAIAGLRNRLLAEHLGTAPEIVAGEHTRLGSLVKAIESLRGGERTLTRLEAEVDAHLETLVPEAAVIDPEHPVDPDRLVDDIVPIEEAKPVTRRIVAATALVAVLGALGIAWRWTPLAQWLELDRLIAAAQTLAAMPAAPLLVIATYIVAGFVAAPITALVVATVLVFGPLEGGLYALAGALASAAVGYGIGRLLGRSIVRQLAGTRVKRLRRRLARGGILTMAALRMVPVAPFTIVNIVGGTLQIRFRDFLIGTVLGLTPGLIAITLFTNGALAALREPSPQNFAVLAVIVAAIAVTAVLVSRRIRTRLAADAPENLEA